VTSQTRKLMFWMDVRCSVIVSVASVAFGFGIGLGVSAAQRLFALIF
jgi:hypothetical protein